MQRFAITLFTCYFLVLSVSAHATSQFSESTAWQTVKRDYANFYTRERLSNLGVAFGIGAVMANTHIDQGIRDWYQDHERSPSSDRLSKKFKWMGNGYNTIPISLLAMGIGQLSSDPANSPMWLWGERTMRAYIVGGPANLFAQVATGGSRPGPPNASQWRPFHSSHGVSGHAFMGAIPFLTIANMSDNHWVRYSAYFASTFVGWSRINDDAHFASQVFLGWYMAYQSTDAVADSDAGSQQHDSHLAVLPWPHGILVAMDYQW